jgi:hypothetical protein
MKRFLTTALILGGLSTFGLVGCSDKSAVTETEKVVTPGGTTTKETSTTIESKGENPPATTAGETVPPK